VTGSEIRVRKNHTKEGEKKSKREGISAASPISDGANCREGSPSEGRKRKKIGRRQGDESYDSTGRERGDRGSKEAEPGLSPRTGYTYTSDEGLLICNITTQKALRKGRSRCIRRGEKPQRKGIREKRGVE